MDWHLNDKVNKYEYGQFDNFNNFIRFNEQFNLIIDIETLNDYKCSETLSGLPFKLCLKQIQGDMILYFEKDIDKNVFDPHFSFRFKEFIDNEFETSKFIFDDNINWDEINEVNDSEYIEKCNYLHIAKICMKQDNTNNSMTASISFQLMNKNKNKIFVSD